MRFTIFLMFALSLLPNAAAWAIDPLPRKLWSLGARSVWGVHCGPKTDGDEYCTSVEARLGQQVITSSTGYENVRLLWRQAVPGEGPAVLVAGDTGGSAGIVDVFAVTFGKSPALQQVQSSHFKIDRVATVAGSPQFELGFAVEAFNGAPNSQTSVIGLPLRWSGQALEVDFPKLLARKVTTTGLARFRAEIAHQHKLEKQGFTPGGSPLIANRMLALVLSGHADKARAVLEAAWPRAAGRKVRIAATWEDFCGSVIAEPAWARFGLSRLPHAREVEAAGRHYFARWAEK